ncbi:sugar transferase [Niallia circulans]|uniref:sugar transferase n=1 Tax=Niallia circulans TaxID=1397 RepID=UPI003AF32F8B
MSLSNNPKEDEKYVYLRFPNSRLETNSKGYTYAKRSIDILCSLLGIIVLLPLFILVGILIKVEDNKGSVFFSQTRVGKNEKLFTMYKFRSMVSNAEEMLEELREQNEASGAMFKIKHDPRVTKIGRFIRKTSIDELPQLFNVLKGDMSLVGPRPPLPEEVQEYTAYHKQRLLVVPGCTGLWQVSGRSNVGFEEMVEMDLTYINMRSVRNDFKIIMRTFYTVFAKNDAY